MEVLHYNSMNTISIGGLEVSQVGLGTFPLKGEVLETTMDYAINNGYTLIDTAYKYKNETEIGSFLAAGNVREQPIIVQTKFSATQLSYKKFLWMKYGRKTTKDAIIGSMKRLQKDCLDIYLLHSPSKGYVDYYGDLIKYRDQGMVKVIGVCKFDEQQLKDIKNAYGEYPSINQIEVHPYYTNKRVIEFCKDNGIAIEARSLFTHGDALNEIMQSESLQNIAEEYNKSIPQIIIRWTVQQGLVALVKSQTISHIKENVDVFDFCLTEKQMSSIDSMNRDKSYGYKSIHLQ